MKKRTKHTPERELARASTQREVTVFKAIRELRRRQKPLPKGETTRRLIRENAKEGPEPAKSDRIAQEVTDALSAGAPAVPLPPPVGYATWLDFAVSTLDTRRLENEIRWGHQPHWPADTTGQQIREAARRELEALRATPRRRLRVLIPGYAKLLGAKPGDDLQADLDADRGER